MNNSLKRGRNENGSEEKDDGFFSRGKRCKIRDLGGGTISCHQCHRSDKGRFVECRKCGRKRYCIPCMTKWYPKTIEKDFAEACPVCRDNCNCKSCLRLDVLLNDTKRFESELSEKEKICHSKYLLKKLLPFIKRFNEEQIMEKETEAKIQGLSLSEVKVQAANCELNERMYCNNCKTSIADFHRSCTRCSYDLCLICCRELRNGCLRGGQEEVIMQFRDPGVAYLHGGEHCPMSSTSSGTLDITETEDEGHVRSESEWKSHEDGSIPCPPENMGGCGEGILILKQVLPENWVSKLLVKAEELSELCKLKDMPETPAWSTCEFYTAKEKLRKAASREDSDDNYLYCLSAVDIQAGDLKHFQSHWVKGEPVIVSNVLETTSGLSWEPMVMSRALREKNSQLLDVVAINCLNWCEVDIKVHDFFKGYLEGRFDNSGWPQILKLKDWPPSSLFLKPLTSHSYNPQYGSRNSGGYEPAVR